MLSADVESSLLTVIASPRRREILRLVWQTELSAGAVHQAMPDVTFGAISQQLGILTDAGLLAVRAEGRRRWYRARRDTLGPIAGMLEAMWGDALARLNLVVELEQARRGPSQRPRSRRRSAKTRRG